MTMKKTKDHTAELLSLQKLKGAVQRYRQFHGPQVSPHKSMLNQIVDMKNAWAEVEAALAEAEAVLSAK